VREQRNGDAYRFEEFTNLEDFEAYRKNIYKYLPEKFGGEGLEGRNSLNDAK